MRKFVLLTVFVTCSSCFIQAADNWKEKTEQADYIHRAIKEVTDVMVHDIYSPPVASRTYAYISVAAYESLIAGHAEFQSMAGQLHELSDLPRLEKNIQISNTLAAVQALLSVARTMTISESRIDDFRKDILEEFRQSGIPNDIFQNSISFGQKIADQIIKWSAQDHYKQTRSMPKYAVSDAPDTWKPTPPSYMKAVEPHWNKIRPFLIDSAQQFKPVPPLHFSTDSNSRFYKEVMAVYRTGNQLTAEQKEVANFWDCNPFKMNISGHVMYATKKISPGGHWINITRLACKMKNVDALHAAEAYLLVSITIADCFISCWDEKFRSRVIRPETYINQYVDKYWMPLLQTPPFPEYTSGHSVVSMASAQVLSRLFGDDFSFTDSTESEFGLPPRKFGSFRMAAKEAAISRFYGGIHYMPSIMNGLDEGEKIGLFVQRKLKIQKKTK